MFVVEVVVVVVVIDLSSSSIWTGKVVDVEIAIAMVRLGLIMLWSQSAVAQ